MEFEGSFGKDVTGQKTLYRGPIEKWVELFSGIPAFHELYGILYLFGK